MIVPGTTLQLRFRSVRRRFPARCGYAAAPLEVAALLNVAILVGMFCFASSGFVLQPGVQVRLPEAPFLDGQAYGARTLAVTAQGLLFYNDEPVSVEDFERRLAAETDGAAEGTEVPLLVEADAGTSYELLMRIWSAAVRNGIDDVVLATRPPAMAPAP